MAHLTKPTTYDIKDSNIALLGSDLEKRVREAAGDEEPAWATAGTSEGLQIWRIEKFKVVEWPKNKLGSFYDGDSYIVLNTYKTTPDAKSFSFDLHFWLGEDTTQDEAGTAAYKTVELDDHLHGVPVQYREVQGYESDRFLSYFPRFVCVRGGVATGFHHVSEAPPLNLHKLYLIKLFKSGTHNNLVVREIAPKASNIVEGDVYVLDKGTHVWQFNTKTSAGKEKFKAAEFSQSLVEPRQGHCDVEVFDEGTSGASKFLAAFGEDVHVAPAPPLPGVAPRPHLFRVSDASGKVAFENIEPATRQSLSSADAFLLDCSFNGASPTIYVWIGEQASLAETRLAPQYAQHYLYNRQAEGRTHGFATSIVKMKEGHESQDFFHAFGA
ncbi:Actin-binding protein [Mycena indigotica]|uniref:Actin-binding protein n=1 Tax=Mycena indigotica TaxID=2126181 RepID=A0A8H6SH46_9AGAR|nr:Actin-binding protein [Mycena indigotica]KAF7298792.1 Actin-binding protein [Mycena indigotica]